MPSLCGSKDGPKLQYGLCAIYGDMVAVTPEDGWMELANEITHITFCT